MVVVLREKTLLEIVGPFTIVKQNIGKRQREKSLKSVSKMFKNINRISERYWQEYQNPKTIIAEKNLEG